MCGELWCLPTVLKNYQKILDGVRKSSMPFALWTLLSLVVYVGGLVILVWVTPHLLVRSSDEGLFMGIAAADIFGGMLAFGAVTITFGIFSGNFGSRVLDFFLLIGILI